MNRTLATVFLALLFSMYCFSQSRFAEGLYVYPLLVIIYLAMNLGKGKEPHEDDDQKSS